MQLNSTNNPSLLFSFEEALFQGLPEDKGLFMPVQIPEIPKELIPQLDKYTFQEIAFQVAKALLNGEIPDKDLQKIIESAISFPAPVVMLDDHTAVLELFHGPSLAFKDFGARFMAKAMAYFNKETESDLIILVATSGDTGGAVAAGFYQTPGIQVVILYPSGKVSPLQEKQLTTLGENIHAFEVEGTFDDCQALVKEAFLDQTLRSKLRLSSANSINIARLIPQIFYYWEAYKQVSGMGKPVVFVVPSGNFGNLTAGLIAQKMGLPVHCFVAATNANDIIPEYLNTGLYNPQPSIPTLSNAMDVGNPSNFARILNLYGSTWNIIKDHITGYAFSDIETEQAMRQIFLHHNYIMDPHGAVGYLAWRKYQEKIKNEALGIIFETAHPAKFLEDVERILSQKIDIPYNLQSLQAKEKRSTPIAVNYLEFKMHLLEAFEKK
ncbi:threonine synthase [candidate division KSB1 bacterium]|nr:threonine synthase [Lewinellaceae bacterium]MCA9734408.1 threonine synthase [candidate division KSB1 bacterium]